MTTTRSSDERKPIRLAILAVAILALAASDRPAFAKRDAKPSAPGPSDLVWPLPPDNPRIRYVESLQGSHDLKKPSRWKRILLGPEADPGLVLKKPYGVATDFEGRVYVSDTGLGAVVVFDKRARDVRVLGKSGRVHLATPVGIALDEKGRVFVSDADLNLVLAFDEKDEVVLALGHEEGLKNPSGIAIDKARRRLYVADSHLHQILVYGTDGAFLGRWGSRGPGPGQFNYPTNLALDDQGNLYVVDTGNFRVEVLDPEGAFVSQFGGAGDGPGLFHRPKGIAVDSEGHVYVVDAAFNNFQVFDREGRLLLFVGAAGRDEGTFWLPAGVHVDDKDRIFVVDQMNRRVQVFQYLSEELD